MAEEQGFFDRIGNLISGGVDKFTDVYEDVSAGDPREQEIAKRNAVRILAGGGGAVSNSLIPQEGAINQDALEASNPELQALLGSPNTGEKVISFPENPFEEDINHMILFQMFEKEDESERIFTREQERLGNEDLGDLIDGVLSSPPTATPLQQWETDFLDRRQVGGQPSYSSRADYENLRNQSNKVFSGPVGERPASAFSYTREPAYSPRQRDQSYKYEANFKPPFVNRSIAQSPKYKSKQNIFLYMPQAINETNVQSYDTPELLLATFASSSIKRAIESGSVGAAFESALDDLTGNASLLTRVGAGFLDSLVNTLGIPLNAEAALTQLRGLAINPRKQQTYTAPDFRTFSYIFELYPRTRRETEAANAMIRLFKYHSYPDLDSTGNLFVTPAIFRIKYLYKHNDGLVENLWLNRIKDCVLQECQVDYTSPGQFTTHADGSPVGIKLSLTFKETTVVTKEDVLEGA